MRVMVSRRRWGRLAPTGGAARRASSLLISFHTGRTCVGWRLPRSTPRSSRRGVDRSLSGPWQLRRHRRTREVGWPISLACPAPRPHRPGWQAAPPPPHCAAPTAVRLAGCVEGGGGRPPRGGQVALDSHPEEQEMRRLVASYVPHLAPVLSSLQATHCGASDGPRWRRLLPYRHRAPRSPPHPPSHSRQRQYSGTSDTPPLAPSPPPPPGQHGALAQPRPVIDTANARECGGRAVGGWSLLRTHRNAVAVTGVDGRARRPRAVQGHPAAAAAADANVRRAAPARRPCERPHDKARRGVAAATVD